jgi:hypothetical protein
MMALVDAGYWWMSSGNLVRHPSSMSASKALGYVTAQVLGAGSGRWGVLAAYGR